MCFISARFCPFRIRIYANKLNSLFRQNRFRELFSLYSTCRIQKAAKPACYVKEKACIADDTLDVTDRHYDKKYQDMQNRLYDFYDEIEVVEEQITELQSHIANIK